VNQARKSKQYCQCLTQNQIKTNSNGYVFCSFNCSLKTWLHPIDNCLTDAQNCLYFNYFNSKEKKLYTRFNDKFEANFEGRQHLEPSSLSSFDPNPSTSDHNPNKTPPKPTEPSSEPLNEPASDKPKQQVNQTPTPRLLDTRPQLFLTLTFNTTDQEHYSWTTNWAKSDPIWDKLNSKKSYLKNWAQNFDNEAEPLKVHIPKLEADVSQYEVALTYLQLFFRRVRRLWKPNQWKWVVVAELQKAKNDRLATWHFHLLSTPIVPYSHQCTLTQKSTSCWNCRTYINQLWPYGRVESRSLKGQSRKQYLAKYISKSFHHRQLYREHGLKEHHKTYRFFKNLYEYDEREALLINNSKLDVKTQQYLAKNQTVFRHYGYATGQTTYFYRTSEKLVGKATKPRLIKKNFRLSTRTLNPLNLLKLASKSTQKEAILFKNPKSPPKIAHDFQEFLITRLLLFCKSAEFLHLPLEQDQVPKLKSQCDQTIYHHFKPKPILHFKFAPEVVPLVLNFLNNLDFYAQEYDIEESSGFYDSRFTDLTESRNAYLNQWQINTWQYRKENEIYRQIQGQSPG
jgi:hypothetical protein